MAPTPAAPVSEIGYVNPSQGWSGFRGFPDDQAEETAAWLWPTSVQTCDRMRRDSTVQMVYTAVTGPIRQPGRFAINPQDADPAWVLKLAEDLDLPIIGTQRPPPLRRRGRFSFLEHVRLALLELFYGHMGFEPLYDKDILETTGEARLRKLAPRFPRSIAEITVARDGGLESITQHRIDNETVRPIPVANLVWYAHEREGAAWQGRSMMRSAYGHFVRLDRLYRARAYLMERQAAGTPVGEAPPGPNGGESTQDQVDRMQEIASQSRSGDQSGIGIPHGGKFTIEGVRGTLPDVTAAIVDERAGIADSVMASFLRLGTSESAGNRALGETFVGQFDRSVDTIAGQLADVLTQHVAEDWWDWNVGENAPAPAIEAKPADAEQDLDPKDLVELIKVGAITPDESIEDFLRSGYKLPKRTITEGGANNATGARNLAVPEIIQKVYLGVGTMLTADEARALVNSAAGAEVLPAGFVPPASNNPTTAGRRTKNHNVRAKSVATWSDRVAEVLSTGVDTGAIAAAVVDGTAPADAVAAGVSADTGPLAALLVELWGDGYGAGQTRAAETAPATAAARRPTVVMASLADMVARAGEIATGILGSLADRLAAALGGDDDASQSTLEELLASAAGDEAAAERIAATEYHRSVVSGAVDTWSSMGITETTWVRTSGSDDSDECAALDGTTSASWGELPPLHPNCECLLEPA